MLCENTGIYLSIGIYKFPKKFLCWGLERGSPFPRLKEGAQDSEISDKEQNPSKGTIVVP